MAGRAFLYPVYPPAREPHCRVDMIEHAYVDLEDASSRFLHFTAVDDPMWSGVVVLAPGEAMAISGGARHDLLVVSGSVTNTIEGSALERGAFAIRGGNIGLRAGPAGAQVFVYRETVPAAYEEATVIFADRPWREGRTPGMLVANLSNASHSLNLIMWQPGAQAPQHAHPRGEEIFVLRGELYETVRYPAGSWMRLHPGAWHSPQVATPTMLLVRSGHLKGHKKMS
jgi:quercetin dioxygenase-like cupin family protein